MKEYQGKVKEYDDIRREFQDDISASERSMKGEISSIQQIKISLAKSQEMIEVVKEKEEIQETENKEIAGDAENYPKEQTFRRRYQRNCGR